MSIPCQVEESQYVLVSMAIKPMIATKLMVSPIGLTRENVKRRPILFPLTSILAE